MKKNILIIGALIIIVVIGFFSWNQLSYSKQVLKLEILGPDQVDVGEEIEYTIKFKNNGKVRLEAPELFFEFPEGAILEDNQKVKSMDSKTLGGDIYPGQERTFSFKARLLGKEGDKEVAKARMIFQPNGLKTKNEVSTTFTSVLGKVPLNLFIETPNQAPSGKSLTVRINYSSNVAYPLNDLTLKVETPGDFQIQYSKPKGTDNQWDIPILNESGSGKIEITGILNGQARDQKVFKAQIGVWRDDNFILLKEVVRGVEIIAPAIYVTQKINNNDLYTALPGDQLHYEVSFMNIGEEPIQNLVLISRLEGNLDLSSIRVPEGNYQQGDNSIVWDSTGVPALQYLDPGEQGKVEFWVKVNNRWPIRNTGDKNPSIVNKVTVGPTNQEFVTKINSSLVAEQRVDSTNSYFSDSQTNFGPYPLEIGRKTYLVIEWTAKNYYNDVEGARMRAILPAGVEFENKSVVSEGTTINFDPNTREVVWEVGSLEAGTGFLKDAKKCAFQVSVTPSQNENVLLSGQAKLSGNDQWTGREIDVQTDPAYAPLKTVNK